MTNTFVELFLPAPWGKLALIAWGESSNQPVMMLHGRQDSAATFIPLVQVLPKNLYYVAVDLPGHGKSDPFPKGIVLSRYHYIHVVEVVVKHMGWKNFIYVGHSMGCEIGLFYNAATPGVISKFVHLDAGPTFQRLQQPDHERYYKHYYHRYYGNYHRYNSLGKVYSWRQALEAVMKARNMTEEQAEIILSRNLVSIGDDKYRLSWDSRAKYVAAQNMTNEYYISLFTTNAPPSLFISMTSGHGNYTRGKEGADFLLENMMKRIKNAKMIVLEGDHDHHVKSPGEISDYVSGFLNDDIVKCKL